MENVIEDTFLSVKWFIKSSETQISKKGKIFELPFTEYYFPDLEDHDWIREDLNADLKEGILTNAYEQFIDLFWHLWK
jgi:hypothetical protein